MNPALRFDNSDLLSRLHTLRGFAQDVKKQADEMHQALVATWCAAIGEEATAAIDHLNQPEAPDRCCLCPDVHCARTCPHGHFS